MGPYHPRRMADPAPNLTAPTGPDGAAKNLAGEVERLLALIRPSVQADGGDLELVEVDPSGPVRIRLLGACVGCPSSHVTLHQGIERTLRSQLGPHIRVEAVR